MIYIIIALILIVAYIFTIILEPTEKKEVKKIKTWQEYESEKPKKMTKPWRVFFTDSNNNIVNSPWNPGKCYPSKKFKDMSHESKLKFTRDTLQNASNMIEWDKTKTT